MIIMGVDHSSRRSGFSICKVEDKKIKVIDTWSYEIKAKDESERLFEYNTYIKKCLLKHNPDFLVLEKPSSMINAKTSRLLIALFSMIEFVAFSLNTKHTSYAVCSVRKEITGNGRSDKIDLFNYIKEKYDIDESLLRTPTYYKNGNIKNYEYDESDATALVICHCLKENLIKRE